MIKQEVIKQYLSKRPFNSKLGHWLWVVRVTAEFNKEGWWTLEGKVQFWNPIVWLLLFGSWLIAVYEVSAEMVGELAGLGIMHYGEIEDKQDGKSEK